MLRSREISVPEHCFYDNCSSQRHGGLALELKMDLAASLVNERPGKSKTLIAAFEKELGYLNSYIRKSKHDNHFIQKR